MPWPSPLPRPTTRRMMGDTTTLLIITVAVVLLMAAVVGWAAFIAARRTTPDTLHHYEQALAEMQQRLERAEQRGDRQQVRIDNQQVRIDQLQAALAAEQDYSRALARAMRDAGLEPPPRPEATPRPTSDTAGLARRVAECYSLEELDGLAFELGLADAVTGEALENRAASLVMAALRRGILSELVAIARRERPRGGF